MSKKQNIKPRNVDGELHGLCIYYRSNGNVDYKERFVNGIEYGIDESYCSDGELWHKRYWNNGKRVYSEWYDSDNRILITI